MIPSNRVMPGERIEGIPAATFNGWQDAAEYVKRQRSLQAPTAWPASIPPGYIQVKNASGENLRRFSIVIPDNPVFEQSFDVEEGDPISDRLDAFKDQPCLRVFPPGPDDDLTSFLVLQEPLSADAIGRALMYGVTAAKLDIQNEIDRYAIAQSGDETTLKTTPYGTARIVWKPAGTGIKWGYISLEPAQPPWFLASITGREDAMYSWIELGTDTEGELNAFEEIYSSQAIVKGSTVRMRPVNGGEFTFTCEWTGQLGKSKGGGIPGRSGVNAGSAVVEITDSNFNVIDELVAFNHSTAPVAANAPLMLKYIRGYLWVDWEQC